MNKPLQYSTQKPEFLFISPEIFDRGIGYTYAGLFSDLNEDATKKQSLLLMAALSTQKRINILLADDDEDDRDLFKEAVEEVKGNANVTMVNDGDALMNILSNHQGPPDIIFLDINMPCKNGQECLREIRQNKKLKEIPVVIYSTSARQDLVDETYNSGANFYVQKPDSYTGIKEIIKKILSLNKSDFKTKPAKENYFISFNDKM